MVKIDDSVVVNANSPNKLVGIVRKRKGWILVNDFENLFLCQLNTLFIR